MARRRSNPGGRPSKFTPKAALAIVGAVTRGRRLDRAAGEAGVGASTLYRWLKAGRAGDPTYAPLVEALGIARRAFYFDPKPLGFGSLEGIFGGKSGDPQAPGFESRLS